MMKIGILASEFTGLKLEDIFRKVNGYGIKYVELSYPLNIRGEPLQNIKKWLSNHRLKVACVNSGCGVDEEDREKVREAQNLIIDNLKIAKELGANYVVMYLGGDEFRDENTVIRTHKENAW